MEIIWKLNRVSHTFQGNSKLPRRWALSGPALLVVEMKETGITCELASQTGLGWECGRAVLSTVHPRQPRPGLAGLSSGSTPGGPGHQALRRQHCPNHQARFVNQGVKLATLSTGIPFLISCGTILVAFYWFPKIRPLSHSHVQAPGRRSHHTYLHLYPGLDSVTL